MSFNPMHIQIAQSLVVSLAKITGEGCLVRQGREISTPSSSRLLGTYNCKSILTETLDSACCEHCEFDAGRASNFVAVTGLPHRCLILCMVASHFLAYVPSV